MKWSRDLKIAKRSMRTALRAVSANLSVPLKAPAVFGKGLDFPDLGSFASTFGSVGVSRTGTERAEEIAEFGSNPGRLRMIAYAPEDGARANAPLVVVLHGCGQGAVDFARGAGWTELADELGFTLIMPEQNGQNNQGRCFQWFQPEQIARGKGEALSIRQMVATAVQRFNADPKRVFVVGLSAGGAMAAALLAAYPDVFAAGAVVAGLPVGTATGTMQAMMRMAHPGPGRTPADWAKQVQDAVPASHRRGWPPISIWHGAADTVVDPGNADQLVTQWGAVHGLPLAPNMDITEPNARHRSWTQAGETVMEQWVVPGMAHGYPIDAESGVAGPFILDVGLSATRHIAQFWGLL
jgi:poly(hydroxyalkanoate) depolymerase family esterase